MRGEQVCAFGVAVRGPESEVGGEPVEVSEPFIGWVLPDLPGRSGCGLLEGLGDELGGTAGHLRVHVGQPKTQLVVGRLSFIEELKSETVLMDHPEGCGCLAGRAVVDGQLYWGAVGHWSVLSVRGADTLELEQAEPGGGDGMCLGHRNVTKPSSSMRLSSLHGYLKCSPSSPRKCRKDPGVT